MDDMVLTGAVSSYAFHQPFSNAPVKTCFICRHYFIPVRPHRWKMAAMPENWHLDKLRLQGGNADSHLGGNAKISFPDPKKEKLRPEFSVWPYGLCNFSTIFENGWWLKTGVLFCEFWQLLQAKARKRLWGKSAFEIWWVHSEGFSNHWASGAPKLAKHLFRGLDQTSPKNGGSSSNFDRCQFLQIAKGTMVTKCLQSDGRPNNPHQWILTGLTFLGSYSWPASMIAKQRALTNSEQFVLAISNNI